MRHSSLMSFLDGITPPEMFGSEIEHEVAAGLKAMSKRGSGHVIITPGPRALITCKHVDLLLGALVGGRLPLNVGSYIADALIMSDDFDFANDQVSEVVFSLSDESAPLTVYDVENLRWRLCRSLTSAFDRPNRQPIADIGVVVSMG